MTLIASNYDLIFLLVISISGIMSLIKGAVSELLSLLVWFFAFICMQHYGQLIEGYIPSSINNPLLKSALIFIIAFVLIAVGMTIIKTIITKLIGHMGLGGLNRILGIGFGIIRGCLFCAIGVIIIEMLNLDSSHSYQHARLYPVIEPLINWISNAIPNKFHNLPKPPIMLPGF